VLLPALPFNCHPSTQTSISSSSSSSSSRLEFLTEEFPMARIKLLLLTYDAEAAAQCSGMVCPLAGPVQHPSKEPVGHIFHYKMLLQQGVIGER
jgi:hypothetical protein